jgi:hypothetical protein
MKRIAIFFSILAASLLVGHRVQEIRSEAAREGHTIARIQQKTGAPMEYVVAKKTSGFLEEPIYIENGRALVSAQRVRKFSAGQVIKGTGVSIVSISKNIDLDTGMFVVRASKNITGNFMVLRPHTGFFLPLEAVLPPNAKAIARDNERMVADGIEEGVKVQVR